MEFTQFARMPTQQFNELVHTIMSFLEHSSGELTIPNSLIEGEIFVYSNKNDYCIYSNYTPTIYIKKTQHELMNGLIQFQIQYHDSIIKKKSVEKKIKDLMTL